jgi:hypothetical protein
LNLKINDTGFEKKLKEIGKLKKNLKAHSNETEKQSAMDELALSNDLYSKAQKLKLDDHNFKKRISLSDRYKRMKYNFSIINENLYNLNNINKKALSSNFEVYFKHKFIFSSF